MSCNDYCCNHGCSQGTDCPARKPSPDVPAIDAVIDFEISPLMLVGIVLSVIAVVAMVVIGLGALFGFFFN